MSKPIYQGFDFHCHLDLYKDRRAVLDDVERAGIFTLAVTTTPRAFEVNTKLFGRSQFVRIGLGIHPELAATREANMEQFRSLATRTNVIGEIGLDARARHRQNLPNQRIVLEEILRTAKGLGPKLYSFHSAGAASDVLRVIEDQLDNTAIKVMHWFSGTISELNRAIEMQCYFSINRAMLTSASGRHIITQLPPQRVLTETDGPFISVRGEPLLPSSVTALPNMMSPLWRERPENVQRVLTQNALSVLTGIGII